MSRRQACFGLMVLMAVILAACGGNGSTPQLIGAYPKVTSAPPPNSIIVYSSTLTLEVFNTSAAADRAAQVAYDCGGYLASSQTWSADQAVYATLTLAVPVSQFDKARDALLRLGTLTNETITGERTDVGYDYPSATYTTLTVNLRPAQIVVPQSHFPISGWSPARTFGRAFEVSTAIFTFLVDAVIWIVVVAGPFVLMALGLRSLIRRFRPRA